MQKLFHKSFLFFQIIGRCFESLITCCLIIYHIKNEELKNVVCFLIDRVASRNYRGTRLRITDALDQALNLITIIKTRKTTILTKQNKNHSVAIIKFVVKTHFLFVKRKGCFNEKISVKA